MNMNRWARLSAGFFLSAILVLPAVAQITDRINGVQTGLAIKAPVIAVTSAPITLVGEQTVNGVALVEGDRVLVKDQADASENGIYVVDGSRWDRAADFDGNRDVVQGTLVVVYRNISLGALFQVTTANPIVIGTSALQFAVRDNPAITYPATAGEASAGVTIVQSEYPANYVLRYGANTTPGTTDLTAAYNAATFSTIAYSLNSLLFEVTPPQGRGRIDGTVYVRKGEWIRGNPTSTYVLANNDGTGPTFKLGWGRIAGVDVADTGGQPVGIGGLYLLGGPATGTIDITGVAGAVVTDVFMTGPANGIDISGSGDVNIDNAIIDLGLTGMTISGASQNNQYNQLKFYNTNYDVRISGTPVDQAFTDFHSEYNKFTSVALEDSATIENLQFNGNCTWVYNEQYGTFTGTILNRATFASVTFNGCVWRNMPGAAYIHGTGIGSVITFNNGTWDGLKTNSAYAQSTAAAAINTSHETLVVNGGIMRNLPGQPITVGGSFGSYVTLNDLQFSGNTGGTYEVLISDVSDASTIKARNITSDRPFNIFNSQGHVEIDYDNGGLVNTQNGNYTITPNDMGGTILKTSGGGNTITIPAQTASKVKAGSTFEIVNFAGGNVSIAITTNTLHFPPSGAEGTRTLATSGRARIRYVGGNVWIITGEGITAVFEPPSMLERAANDSQYELAA